MPVIVSLHSGDLVRQLTLRYSPNYLRVVYDRETGQWDALDLTTDTPRATEKVSVYRLRPGSARDPVHLRFAPGKGRSGLYFKADYDRLPDEAQPPREEIATPEGWDAWVARQQ